MVPRNTNFSFEILADKSKFWFSRGFLIGDNLQTKYGVTVGQQRLYANVYKTLRRRLTEVRRESAHIADIRQSPSRLSLQGSLGG